MGVADTEFLGCDVTEDGSNRTHHTVIPGYARRVVAVRLTGRRATTRGTYRPEAYNCATSAAGSARSYRCT